MNARRILALLALALMVAACGGEAAKQEPEPKGPDYKVITDDGDFPDQIQGEPGKYAFTARGAWTPPLAIFDVPAGYYHYGHFALAPTDSEYFHGLQYWTVYGVHDDPCNRTSDAPESGDSVEELAAALAAQRRSQVSEPQPITLNGHEGMYLELTVPKDVVIEDCTDGYYVVWDGRPADSQHTIETPGTVERIWILDVQHGERVVLALPAAAGTTDDEVDELVAIVESVRFLEY